jgi:hypothetical protein
LSSLLRATGGSMRNEDGDREVRYPKQERKNRASSK